MSGTLPNDPTFNKGKAGAELTVSSQSDTTQSNQPAPYTFVSTLDASNEYDDADIENFLGGGSSYTTNTVPQCNHTSLVKPMPAEGFDLTASCSECASDADNWICLSCFKVYCSRYINQHMIKHTEETNHPIVLSFTDVSVWCYGCDDFVEHDAVSAAKDFALNAKYGSPKVGLNL